MTFDVIRRRSAAVVFIFVLASALVLTASASAQFMRPSGGKGALKIVNYPYNGQTYQIMVMNGQPMQVRLNNQVVVMVSNGMNVGYPGLDAHLVANAEDALKAYEAANGITPPGTPAGGAAPPAAAHSGGGLTVDGVVQMLDAGLSDEIILDKIHSSGQSFDLSTDDLIRLKKSKASDAVIKAMMDAKPGATATASAAPASSTAATPAVASATATPPAPAPAAQPAKKEGFFSSIGHDVNDTLHGRTVIDKEGLRNILPEWDPQKPLSEQFPHVAITVLSTPNGWMDPYATDKSASGQSVFSSCFKLKAVVWSDAEHSKSVGPFDWCSNHDEMMADLMPSYPYTLMGNFASARDTTGVNRTDGPEPPEKLLPTDRATMDMIARTNPRGLSIDLNTDASSRFALMFANVRKDLGETLTTNGDYRVWIVSIKKAGGPSLF
jgi:hypothetical protein